MTLLDPIDTGCGCDSPARLHGLLSIDEALRQIRRATCPVKETETLPLARAKGRVLAQAVTARANVPPFDNAAMDGYALKAAMLQGDGPWCLPVAGRIPAGASSAALEPGCAARIFTGAPMPSGADAVVMQEEATRTGDIVTIHHRPDCGRHVRLAGEDMAQGAEVVPAGARLDARGIAACAAAGWTAVTVHRALRVALLVTGDEVERPGEHQFPDRIRDVNGPMLTACLDAPGIDLIAVSYGADTPQALQDQLTRMAASADLIVTTGGLSVGEEDHVKPAITALGGKVHVSGVAIKPGKPLSFGTLGQALWLGLPGNPLSALVTWQVFGSTLLRRLSGQAHGLPCHRHVVLAAPIRRKPGRCELHPAWLAGVDAQGRDLAHCAGGTHSARVAGLPHTDGLLFLPAETDSLPKGALVEFQPFQNP